MDKPMTKMPLLMYLLFAQPVHAGIVLGVWWLLTKGWDIDAPTWSFYLTAYFGAITTPRHW